MSSFTRKKAVLLLMCAALGPLCLRAEEGETRDGWSFSQSLAGQVNPLGLSADSRLFYTWPLFPQKQGPLWDTCRVEAGAHNSLTPAFNTISAFVRVCPIAFLELMASAGLRGYYDAFGYGYTPLAGYDASWDSRDTKDAGRFRAEGFRYGFTATLKAAAGPFAFGSATSCVIYDMYRAGGGSSYYYDPSSDTALRLFDGFITNDSLLLYAVPNLRPLRLGITHTILYVPGSRYTSRRLCALGRFEGDLGPLKASAAILAGVFLQDRYNSWKAGKLYAAIQTGCTLNL
jgi:hypothetical protein